MGIAALGPSHAPAWVGWMPILFFITWMMGRLLGVMPPRDSRILFPVSVIVILGSMIGTPLLAGIASLDNLATYPIAQCATSTCVSLGGLYAGYRVRRRISR